MGDNHKAYLLLDTFGKGDAPLLYPTLWVTSSKIIGLAATFQCARNPFGVYGIGVDVDNSRGVFAPLSGSKAKMTKETLDLKYLTSVSLDIIMHETQRSFIYRRGTFCRRLCLNFERGVHFVGLTEFPKSLAADPRGK